MWLRESTWKRREVTTISQMPERQEVTDLAMEGGVTFYVIQELYNWIWIKRDRSDVIGFVLA